MKVTFSIDSGVRSQLKVASELSGLDQSRIVQEALTRHLAEVGETAGVSLSRRAIERERESISLRKAFTRSRVTHKSVLDVVRPSEEPSEGDSSGVVVKSIRDVVSPRQTKILLTDEEDS